MKRKVKGYTRLSKRGYVYHGDTPDGPALMVVPIETLRKHPSIRKDLGITNEQWEAVN
jgi:hypothetical protein